MNKNEIMNMLAKEAAQVVKEQATAALSSLSANDLRPIVEEQLKTITGPLQQEAETTGSVWVKIRNRFYIRIINNAIDNIIKTMFPSPYGVTVIKSRTGKF